MVLFHDSGAENMPDPGDVNVPDRVLDSVGYPAWTALSWAIHHGWVREYKLYMSQEMARIHPGKYCDDVGTPLAVQSMIQVARGNVYLGYAQDDDDLVNSMGLELFAKRVPRDKNTEFYEFLCEGYLLGTDFVSPIQLRENGDLLPLGVVPDEHGVNQLEGELKRYWGKKIRSDPLRIVLEPDILEAYCAQHNLQKAMPAFRERLGF